MSKNIFNKTILLICAILFALNFSPVFAQVMQIEVIGGGYRLRGPNLIQFPNATASFSNVQTVRDIRELNAQDETNTSNTNASDYIAIVDQNGGNPFQVGVSATNFIAGSNNFANTNLEIKNADGNGATNDIIAENARTSLNGVQLDSGTESYTNLGTQRILFTSQGRAPGAWRIFPVFRLTIPGGTAPGTYNSTLTFTII